MSDLWQIGLVLGLVAINAAFSGSELALISLREAQLARLEVTSRGGRVLAKLARDPNRFLATIQIGITLAGFMASATAAVSLSERVVPLLEPLGDADEVMAIVLVTLVLTFFTLVFGELAPKRIAMQHTEGWALAVARPLDFLARIARPAVWLLSASTNLIVKLLGGDPSRQREEVTAEEIRDMIATQQTLTPDAQRVISGAFEVGNRTLREVLIPRPRVFALPVSTPIATAIDEIVASSHTRVPVYAESLDDLLGVVHLRDLIHATGDLKRLVAPAPTFPESMPVLVALRELQRRRNQMAVVADEHGGIEGIVTIEDLVEEIVGEIYDEYDRDVQSVARNADGSLLLPGTFPVHDLIDVGIVVPEGRYTTVAGLILEQLGRIPAVGESVEVGDWRLEVVEASPVAILSVRAAKR